MQYDYFISHASEDKDLIARPLAHFLKTANFNIWFDEFSLKLGDSLRASIDGGLAESSHGIAILSRSFFEKSWTRRELAALVSLTTESRRLLPIWHNVNASDVAKFSPMLADVKAATTERGLQWVAEQIVTATAPDRLSALPLSNINLGDDPEVERARNVLRKLLEGQPSTGDVFLYLSAYQSLLRGLFGYRPLIVPAHKLPNVLPFHFAVISPHGVTGPMEIIFVILGPISEGLIDGFVDDLVKSIGKSKRFSDRPANDNLGHPYVGEYEATTTVAEAAAHLAPCDNIHSPKPKVWSFRFLIFAGRRDINEVEAPERVRRSGVRRLEIASYDRLLDSGRNQFN